MNDTRELPVLENTIGQTIPDFRSIVEEHKRSIYALSYELTGNHHDAEDLSQDVFIKVYKSLDTFRGDAGLFSWMYRITVNTYLNKRQKKTLLFRKLTDTFEGLPTRSEDAVHTDSTVMLEKHLAIAMQKLSASEKAAFVLRHKQDLSIRDVATTMEIAEGTVKSLLHRGLKKLRRELHFYRDELGLQNRTES